MAWTKSREDRQRDAQVYGAEYKHNRQVALQRAGGRCQKCGSGRRLQVDHIVPISQGGSHDLANLQVLCEPCHDKKTARQSGGWRASMPRDPDPRPRTRWLSIASMGEMSRTLGESADIAVAATAEMPARHSATYGADRYGWRPVTRCD